MGKHKKGLPDKVLFKGKLHKTKDLTPEELKEFEEERKLREKVMIFDRDASRPSQAVREAEAAANERKKKKWQR